MRATLRANSSTSGEPPLTGSDGALTATPQFGFRRRPALALRDRRWTLLITAARRIIGLCQGAYARARARPSVPRQGGRLNLALVILQEYGRPLKNNGLGVCFRRHSAILFASVPVQMKYGGGGVLTLHREPAIAPDDLLAHSDHIGDLACIRSSP